MEIVSEKRNEGVLVLVKGRMDAVTAPEFEKACSELADGGASLVVTDLSGLEYISSAGLRSILASAKKLKAGGGNLKFCGLTGMVEEVFRVSGFAAMFTIVPTSEEAFGC